MARQRPKPRSRHFGIAAATRGDTEDEPGLLPRRKRETLYEEARCNKRRSAARFFTGNLRRATWARAM
jgi:hypothetical protein